jgi:predicted dehydrogenase
MLVWNDLEADEKIKIYDKGVDVNTKESSYNLRVSYRSGDMHAPRVDQCEALRNETDYFIRCVTNGERPVNDGRTGLRVVKMLEACNQSIQRNGQEIVL